MISLKKLARYMISLDVKTEYTFIPKHEATDIFKNRLQIRYIFSTWHNSINVINIYQPKHFSLTLNHSYFTNNMEG